MSEPSTTPNGTDDAVAFTVTHPFHPLTGQRFPLLAQRVAWGEPRVFFLDPASGKVRSLPQSWTSIAPPDAFRQVAAGRAILRLTDLQALAELLRELRATLCSTTIEPLHDALKSLESTFDSVPEDDAKHRKDAYRVLIDALGQFGDHSTVEVLVHVAEHTSYSQLAMVEAIVPYSDPSSFVFLRKRLAGALASSATGTRYTMGKDISLAERVIDALVKIGDAGASDVMVSALQHKNASIRKKASLALDALGWKPNAPDTELAYWSAKEDWDNCVRLGEMAVRSLVSFRGEAAQQQCGLIRALAEVDAKWAIDILIGFLHSDRTQVYDASVEALVRIGEKAVSPLLDELDSPSSARPQLIERCLIRIGECAVESVISRLESGNETARQVAIEALGEIGGVRAVTVLNSRLTDKAGPMRGAVAMSLLRAGWAPDYSDDDIKLVNTYRDAIGDAEHYHRIGTDPLAELLTETHNIDTSNIRQTLRKLGKTGDPRAINLLIHAFKSACNSTNIVMGLDASRELGMAGGSDAIEALVTVLMNGSGTGTWFCRDWATKGLGLIGDQRAVWPLALTSRTSGGLTPLVRDAYEALDRLAASGCRMSTYL